MPMHSYGEEPSVEWYEEGEPETINDVYLLDPETVKKLKDDFGIDLEVAKNWKPKL